MSSNTCQLTVSADTRLACEQAHLGVMNTWPTDSTHDLFCALFTLPLITTEQNGVDKKGVSSK